MSKPKIAVVVPADTDGDTYRRMEEAGCEVVLADKSWAKGFNASADEYLALCEGADAIVGQRLEAVPITRDLLAATPDLRIYGRYNIGYDDIDLDAATDLGVLVTHSPVESNWGAVAENTFAFMLGLLKNVRERDRHVKEGGWRGDDPGAAYLGRRQDGYEGLTIGIVGLGRVGSRLADLLQPWRVNILAHDPYVDDARFVHHGVTRTELDELLRVSDVVTLHCDLNHETRQVMNARTFGLMKPGAVFINAARGGLVDQDALFHALDQDKIAGAALDVLEDEPPPKQSPILGLGDKVLLAPHTAGRTTTANYNTPWPLQAEALLAALRGQVPKNIVNPDALPKWRQRFSGKSLL
jgi:D-3-phosphoglycerate dehydrogenase / 2-oxoglutarate reductase